MSSADGRVRGRRLRSYGLNRNELASVAAAAAELPPRPPLNDDKPGGDAADDDMRAEETPVVGAPLEIESETVVAATPALDTTEAREADNNDVAEDVEEAGDAEEWAAFPPTLELRSCDAVPGFGDNKEPEVPIGPNMLPPAGDGWVDGGGKNGVTRHCASSGPMEFTPNVTGRTPLVI